MKIGIYNHGQGFSPRWVKFCIEHGIEYKEVNPYASDIINQLSDCDAFMWHHSHADYRDQLFAKQLLASLEAAGKAVFPNHATGWHFDDKVGEMYLFQALGLPVVPSYVFYTKADALAWARETTYPKVFKLRGGAGSMNVKLVSSYAQAKHIVNRCFGRGFKSFRSRDYFLERFNKWRQGKDTFIGVLKGLARFIIRPKGTTLYTPHKGYAYFQDFIPGNSYDTRITVVGQERAVAFRRGVRRGDFRASGSGDIMYDNIDPGMLRLAFRCAELTKSDSIALDFICDASQRPLIVECSYGFSPAATEVAGRYWTKDMKEHKVEGGVPICDWMVESVVRAAENNKKAAANAQD